MMTFHGSTFILSGPITINLGHGLSGSAHEGSSDLHQIRAIINQLGNSIMTSIADLQARVAANTEVTASAVLLIQGLKAKLDAAIASGDPSQLQALSDSLAASDQALADAISANTPADTSAPAPAPVEAPAPAPVDAPAEPAPPADGDASTPV